MNYKKLFSSFSVDDLGRAREFYKEVLGLGVSEREGMGLELKLPEGGMVFVYPKEDHEPAEFTVLNLVVEDIEVAVDELKSKGVEMERYDLEWAEADERGIYRSKNKTSGLDMAWFRDPASNVMALIEEKGGESNG